MAHILVVDDDPDILRLMQFTLTNAKHTITIAADGQSALSEIKKKTPDLIIADIMMPEMTGYQFTRQVRAMPGLEQLPILIYSARFQPIDQETALNAGATDYVPKTMSPREIIGKVNDLLEKSRIAGKSDNGKTIGFFSLRGGVGVSTLAVNVAAVVGLSRKVPIALVDAHPLAGHAGLMLGMRPPKSLIDLQQDSRPLSDKLIDTYAILHKPTGIQLLASPLKYTSAKMNHGLANVLLQLKTQFQYSIFDLPALLTVDVLAALPLFDQIVLVCAPDLPALQSAAVAMKTLPKASVLPENIHPVLNVNVAAPMLKRASVEKTLRATLYAEIPFVPQMSSAVHNGLPIAITHPKADATTAIAQLAAKLLKD